MKNLQQLCDVLLALACSDTGGLKLNLKQRAVAECA